MFHKGEYYEANANRLADLSQLDPVYLSMSHQDNIIPQTLSASPKWIETSGMTSPMNSYSNYSYMQQRPLKHSISWDENDYTNNTNMRFSRNNYHHQHNLSETSDKSMSSMSSYYSIFSNQHTPPGTAVTSSDEYCSPLLGDNLDPQYQVSNIDVGYNEGRPSAGFDHLDDDNVQGTFEAGLAPRSLMPDLSRLPLHENEEQLYFSPETEIQERRSNGMYDELAEYPVKIDTADEDMTNGESELIASENARRQDILRDSVCSKWVKLTRMTPQRIAKIRSLAKSKNIDLETVDNILALYTDSNKYKMNIKITRFEGDDIFIKITMGSGSTGLASDSESEGDHTGLTSKKKQRKRRSGHVKRPLNSFMLYRKSQTQSAMAFANWNHLKLNHQNISQIIGLMWQTENKELKDEFASFAQQEKEIHRALHPDYKFCPQKKHKKNIDEVRSRCRTTVHA